MTTPVNSDKACASFGGAPLTENAAKARSEAAYGERGEVEGRHVLGTGVARPIRDVSKPIGQAVVETERAAGDRGKRWEVTRAKTRVIKAT